MRFSNIGLNYSFGSKLALLFLTLILFCIDPVSAAPPHPAKQKDSPENEVHAPGAIGNSGFVVPVPEINMKNIIGKPPGNRLAFPGRYQALSAPL